MSIASSVARSVATPVARAVAGLGGGGSVWTPASLANLRQWLSDNYYSSPVGGLQVIESLETHGTVRAPQPGACALFDGTNDYGTLGARLLTGTPTALTISFWLNTSDANGTICEEWTSGVNRSWGLYLYLNKLYFDSSSNGSTFSSASVTANANSGTPEHWVVAYSSGSVIFYRNGVAAAGTSAAAASLVTTTAPFQIGGQITSGELAGKLWDLRVYGVTKTAPEALALSVCDFTNLDRTGIIAGWYLNDRAGTTARDWSGNGHDLTLSGPITEATFWAEDSSITANPANVLGYTLSGSTIIPRDESDITKDVQGNALQYTGLSPYPVTIDTPCITLDGANDHATIADTAVLRMLGDATISLWVRWTGGGDYWVLSKENLSGWACAVCDIRVTGGKLIVYFGDGASHGTITSTADVVADTYYHITYVRSGTSNKLYINGILDNSTTYVGVIADTGNALYIGRRAYSASNFLDGSVAGIRFHGAAHSDDEVLAIFNGTDVRDDLVASWKCQDGPGSSNTNVTIYDDSGNGNHLTLTNATVASAWANRCPGYVRDHAFEYGGRLDALGAFCPLVPGTLLCADGNAATIAAGTIPPNGNPYSRVNFDPFDAAELGALAVPSEFDSLPCVTGNGTNVYIDMGSQFVPLSGDFELEMYAYLSDETSFNVLLAQSDSGGVWTSSLQIFYTSGWKITYGDYIANRVAITHIANAWQKINIRKVGTTLYASVNGGAESSATCLGTITGNQNLTMLGSVGSITKYVSQNRISSVSITVGTVTKHIPLTDGSGDDIACYEAGVATIISNAIQGTLTNVWANKTEGQVDHEFPEAVRAIVPRDTKFTNGSTKTITTSEPAVGADLDNILGYIG